MNVKKFTAATSREALRKVREALGPDAVILSNRPVDGVVEILALDNDDVASLSSPSAESEMAAPRPHLNMAPEAPAAPAARAFADIGRAYDIPAEPPARPAQSHSATARQPAPSLYDLDEPAP